MAETLRLIEPGKLKQNPDNPRLIFHQKELESWEESIASQGILVPLTVYSKGKSFFILDGERRWRCALKLGLKKVPVISQPQPNRLQNIMMMFAIHNARKDWDPLPTALKLQELEDIFTKQQKRSPNETELAELASIGRGEVRRLKKLLALPKKYKNMLMKELEKPRAEQKISVDHVLEATKGAEALLKRDIIDKSQLDELRQAIIKKFRSNVIKNTVAPRKLALIARAVDRGDIDKKQVRKAVKKIETVSGYSIDDAYNQLAKNPELEYQTEQLVVRTVSYIKDNLTSRASISKNLRNELTELRNLIDKILKF